MSKVIGIICEYNPFHKGHKYQIDQIRALEPDATVVAIMSGNVVQRGEFAMMSKYDRAEIAIECGVNAVFEMAYPYCGSCAEVFANAGVALAYELGCDSIYFGVEKLSVDELTEIAIKMENEDFKSAVDVFLKDKSCSLIAAREKALAKLGYEAPRLANDMLGLEYIRAINKRALPLEYKAIQRTGAFYSDESFGEIMSASAIRKHYYETGEMVSVPDSALKLYLDVISNGRVLNKDNAEKLIHSYCLFDGIEKTVFDSTPEMVALIKNKAYEAVSGKDFVSSLSSKAFTTARLKRAILYSLFNVEKVCFSPEFTVLLAMDKKGQALLNKIRKNSNICVITKHSDGKKLSEEGKKSLDSLYRLDALFNTLLQHQDAPSKAYKTKPILK